MSIADACTVVNKYIPRNDIQIRVDGASLPILELTSMKIDLHRLEGEYVFSIDPQTEVNRLFGFGQWDAIHFKVTDQQIRAMAYIDSSRNVFECFIRTISYNANSHSYDILVSFKLRENIVITSKGKKKKSENKVENKFEILDLDK